MVLSNLEQPTRSLGGVDSVCQMHLEKLLQDDSQREYLIVAFNPANDTSNSGKIIQLTPKVSIVCYDEKKSKGIWKFLPNVIWQNVKIEKHFRTFHPHIIHTHIPSWKVLPTRKSKKITTLHAAPGMENESLSFLNKLFFGTIIPEFCLLTSDIVTTVSIDERNRLSKRKKLNLKFIANGINPIFSKVKKTNSKENKKIFVVTGAIVKGKRVNIAICSFFNAMKETENIKLEIVGKNDGSSYYQALLTELHKNSQSENSIFAGGKNATEITDIYKSAHCGLFLSAQETFGLTPLEMIAAGLPLISTPVGIMKWEREKFEQLGVRYVDIDDVEATTKAILEMSNYPPSDETLLQAKKYVVDNFSQSSIYEKYIALYEDVCHD